MNTSVRDSSIIALRKMGKRAVPSLIETLKDRRPTRSAGLLENGGVITRNCDVALEIIESIASRQFDFRTRRGSYLSTASERLSDKIIEDVKQWWAGEFIAWGEPVEGVQVRLRSEQKQWEAGQIPSFRVDIRNEGERHFELVLSPNHWEIELDGTWFRASAIRPYLPVRRALSPGVIQEGIPYAPEERAEWKSRPGNKPIEFTAGKHVIRVAFTAHPRAEDGGTPVRAISNPVEIEIQPAGQLYEGSERFKALLELRDRPDPKAVNALEKVLADHVGSTRIHRFAAAQALFCIDTKEAHDILSKYLLTDEYPVDMGIKYTFHWDMAPAKRDAFIKRYHLQATRKDLNVSVDVLSVEDKGPWSGEFVITIKNTSDQPLRVNKPQFYLGMMLLLEDADGHFIRRMETVRYKMPPVTEKDYPMLAPGQHLGLRLKGKLEPNASGQWVLDCKDVEHFIGKPGKFRVYLVYAITPGSAKLQTDQYDPPPVWSGRIVSEPVEIKILAATGASRGAPGEPVAGLKCQARPIKAKFAFSEKPRFEVTLTNTSDKPLEIIGYAQYRDGGPAGRHVPCASVSTSFPDGHRSQRGAEGATENPTAIRINPGKSWRFELPHQSQDPKEFQTADPDQLPRIWWLLPGTYTAQAGYFIRDVERERLGAKLAYGPESGDLAGQKPQQLWEGIIRSVPMKFEVLEDDSKQLAILKAIYAGKGLEHLRFELTASKTTVQAGQTTRLILKAHNTGQERIYLGDDFRLRKKGSQGSGGSWMSGGVRYVEPQQSLEARRWNFGSGGPLAPEDHQVWVEYRGIRHEKALAKSNELTITVLEKAVLPATQPTEILKALKQLEGLGETTRDLQAELRLKKLETLVDDETIKEGQLYYEKNKDQIRFRVSFYKTFQDNQPINDPEHFLLSERWLTHRQGRIKREDRYEVIRPGQTSTDLMRIGKSPLPIPIGQETEDVLNNFQVSLIEPNKEIDPPEIETVHLKLVPKKGTELAVSRTRLEFWLREKDNLVVRSQWENDSGDIFTADMSNLRINKGIKDKDFRLPRLPGDYEVGPPQRLPEELE